MLVSENWSGQINSERLLGGDALFHRDSGEIRGKRMVVGGRTSVRNLLYMAV